MSLVPDSKLRTTGTSRLQRRRRSAHQCRVSRSYSFIPTRPIFLCAPFPIIRSPGCRLVPLFICPMRCRRAVSSVNLYDIPSSGNVTPLEHTVANIVTATRSGRPFRPSWRHLFSPSLSFRRGRAQGQGTCCLLAKHIIFSNCCDQKTLDSKLAGA